MYQWDLFTLNPLNIGYVDEDVIGIKEFKRVPSFFNLTKILVYFKGLPPDLKEFYLEKLYKNSYEVIERIEKPLEYLENLEFDEKQSKDDDI